MEQNFELNETHPRDLLNISIVNDAVLESNETITIILSVPDIANVELVTPEINISIIDNDSKLSNDSDTEIL